MPWTPDWPRVRRIALRTVGGLVALFVVAWLGVPPLAKSLAQDRLGTLLGRQVSMQAVHFNPLLWRLSVDDLVVAGAQPGQAPQMSLGHLELDVSAGSLWRRAPVVEALRVERPRLRLARVSAGHYDIDDILARLQTGQPPSADATPVRFALYNLQVTDGQLDLNDQPVQRQHQVRALNLGLPFLSNLDLQAVQIKVEPRLAFQLDGTSFDTGAQATPFAADRAGSFSLRTGELNLADWLPYLPASLPVQARQGRLSLDLQMQFAAPAKAAPRVQLTGKAQLRALQLTDRAGEELARLDSLQLGLTSLDPLRRQASVDRLVMDGLQLHLARDARGALNWLRALDAGQGHPPVSAPQAAASEPVASADGAWQLQLAQLGLHQARVDWRDEAVRPAAGMAWTNLNLDAQRLRWPLLANESATLSVSARLDTMSVNPPQAPPRPPVSQSAEASAASAPLHLDGSWSAQGGVLKAELDQWALGQFAPYLAQHLRPRLDGQLSLQAVLGWAGLPGAAPPQLSVPRLQVDKLRLTDAAHRAPPLAEWASLSLSDMKVDLATRQIRLDRLALKQPTLWVERDAAGRLALQDWVVAAVPSAAPPQAAPVDGGAAWQFALHELALEGGQARWRDAAAGPQPVSLDLSGLQLMARGLQWPPLPNAELRLQGSARLAAPKADKTSAGRVEWAGQVQLARPAWKGRARVDRLPLHALAPYLGPDLPVRLAHADADWQGDTALRLGEDGLSLNLQGEARLNDLHVLGQSNQGGPGDELLSWHSLGLKGLRVALAPGARPKVEVGEATLADFYAALLVTEQGRFNLNDLSAKPAATSPAATESAAGAAPAAAASAASAPRGVGSGWPLELTLGGVQLVNGKIDFSDHFIRPNYSAALSELNGRLGAFRSEGAEAATLELRGKVAGTAALEVRGTVNPATRPPALDIQARATDLELAPLSPYAGKYAGYAIERGKLSMDVGYRIQPDGRLEARNQIVLNQLTFGERIESPDATHLPVLLAVALLKDRNGVIDLDLPIGGSLNDPQFSVGGLIVKVILNLLGKALTAPFALLSGSGSDDLSVVEFQPGTAQLVAGSNDALNKVARALSNRPALQLTVAGEADPQQERTAIQAAQLQSRLLAEQRKDWLKSGEAPDTEPPALTAELRTRLLQRIYSDTKLTNKPRNLVGLAKELPPAEMEALLLPSFPVTEDTARELALRRAVAVRDALLAQGLGNERLFLAAPKLHAGTNADGGTWTPRVQLQLAAH